MPAPTSSFLEKAVVAQRPLWERMPVTLKGGNTLRNRIPLSRSNRIPLTTRGLAVARGDLPAQPP